MALAEFNTHHGANVVVDQRDDDLGLAEVARSGDTIMSSTPLDTAIRALIDSVADAFLSGISDSDARPDDLSVRFGIRLHYRSGAVLTTGDASHFDVTMSWTRA